MRSLTVTFAETTNYRRAQSCASSSRRSKTDALIELLKVRVHDQVNSTAPSNASASTETKLSAPQYAIVKLSPSTDVLSFYKLLLENGFVEVSFVNEVRENAFLPYNVIADLLQEQIGASISAAVSSDCNDSVGTLVETEQESTLSIDVTEDDVDGGACSESSPSPEVCSATSLAAASTPIKRQSTPNARGRNRNGNVDTDDSQLYAECRLCKNRIMASRLSNLSNHVRRHAALKQFRCVHCFYAHNEMAKVRLHMQNNHKDVASQPFDALTPEMQHQWEVLMEKCFPGYGKGGKNSDSNEQAERESANDGSTETSSEATSSPTTHVCLQCALPVSSNDLISHLNTSHFSECVPFSCQECDYQSTSQWHVRLHIALKHSEKAAEISVKSLAAGSNLQMFVKRYFPDTTSDNSEEKMIADLGQLAPKFDTEEIKSLAQESQNPQQTDSADFKLLYIRCELCHKLMTSNCPLSTLMNHAKRHYNVKQFRCEECDYAAYEYCSIKSHIALKHPNREVEAVDDFDEELQKSWIEVMKRCFPILSSQIDSTFKDLSSNKGLGLEVPSLEESKKSEEPVITEVKVEPSLPKPSPSTSHNTRKRNLRNADSEKQRKVVRVISSSKR
ncbi:hypothetical protein L596_003255 [Steinernema carpocapsae]|uniref:C2H2-type domain-containing protein n=1 Tax=Steinernema carpocapsae TaxID=34508 RepID=A0A4U8UTL3_STECR|nr:hypothetical protein L596_003255 [Steinernema carpocapsae]